MCHKDVLGKKDQKKAGMAVEVGCLIMLALLAGVCRDLGDASTKEHTLICLMDHIVIPRRRVCVCVLCACVLCCVALCCIALCCVCVHVVCVCVYCVCVCLHVHVCVLACACV